MPKTEAERKLASGWSKELEQIEIDRFLSLFDESVAVLSEFSLAVNYCNKAFIEYTTAIKEVDFDGNA